MRNLYDPSAVLATTRMKILPGEHLSLFKVSTPCDIRGGRTARLRGHSSPAYAGCPNPAFCRHPGASRRNRADPWRTAIDFPSMENEVWRSDTNENNSVH